MPHNICKSAVVINAKRWSARLTIVLPRTNNRYKLRGDYHRQTKNRDASNECCCCFPVHVPAPRSVMSTSKTKPHSKRVLIIGGSIAGLLAGNRFQRMGWEVDIFERVDGPLQGRGTGITILPGLAESFAAAGVVEQQLGIELPARLVLDREGGTIAERQFGQPMTSWTRLFELLKAAFPEQRYHRGVGLEQLEQDDGQVTAYFADGTNTRADILIGADGFRSTVRSIICPDAQPIYPGYIAWRCLVDEAALSALTCAVLTDRYVICAAPGEQAIAYAVPGPNFSIEPGKRQFNIVWYHPVPEDQLPRFLSDDTGRYFPNGIPPALLSKRIRDEMIDIAQRALAPPFAEAIRVSPVHFFQPILDLVPQRIALGRVAIVGDAAFIARPHTAMGVSKAGGDVLALSIAIKQNGHDYQSGLQAFETERMRVNRAIVANGQYLGQYMEAQTKSDQARRDAEKMRTPDYILAMAMPMVDYP